MRVNLTDGSSKWFDVDKATVYDEATYHDGRNFISQATGSQWDHEELYRTRSGMWVLHSWSQWQGSTDSYTQSSAEEAYDWLIRNDYHDQVPAGYLSDAEV